MKTIGLMTLLVVLAACGTDESSQNEPNETTNDEELPESKTEAAELTNQGKGDFSLDVCEHFEWYNDGSCEWFCPTRDPDCNADPLGPNPAGEPTTYPIVLAHGFMASPTNFWAFQGVAEALRADGHVVFEGEVPPFNAPQIRAEFLRDQVDAVLTETGAAKVHVIAHSMGGLDSRYLVSPNGLNYGEFVQTVTTISSPHRGTRIADAGLDLIPGLFDDAINALLEAVGKTFSNEAEEADFRASLEALAEQNMPSFNAEIVDSPDVVYESWAGISSVTGIANGKAEEHCEGELLKHEGTYDHTDALLWAMVPFVGHGTKTLPNDGMSTVESSKWGTFKGCIPADHLDEVGQIEDESDLDTGFDHIRFYRNVAFGLSERGW